MSTVTAQILVGQADQNHGGISPTHCMLLSENSRPVWELVPLHIYTDTSSKETGIKIGCIPTLENMLEDAMLMIGIHVLKFDEITGPASTSFKNKDPHFFVMYDDISEADRKALYNKCRALENCFKVVVTAMEGSSIFSHLKVLKKYKMDVEVCMPSYSRHYSAWTQQTREQGTLDCG